jgi:hypothetical protein
LTIKIIDRSISRDLSHSRVTLQNAKALASVQNNLDIPDRGVKLTRICEIHMEAVDSR